MTQEQREEIKEWLIKSFQVVLTNSNKATISQVIDQIENIITPPIDGGTKEEIIEPFTFMLNEAEGIKVLTHGRAMEAMETYASLRTTQLEAKVNELESSLSKEREARQWISVEERLPDADERKGSDRVFAIWLHSDGHKSLEIMAYCFIEDGDGYYAWCNCYGDIYGDPENDDNYNIIAWMPLPQPPKK